MKKTILSNPLRRVAKSGIALLLCVAMVGCGGTKKKAPAANDDSQVTIQDNQVPDEPTVSYDVTTEEGIVALGETLSVDFIHEEGITVPGGITVPEYTVEMNDALKFVADMKVGWNLGNTLDATDGNYGSANLGGERAWGQPLTTQQMIDAVYEAGFNTIRIPVSWHNHLLDDDFTVAPEWMARVKEIVDYAYAHDMYVILNTHHDVDERFYYPDNAHYETSSKYLTAIWTQVSETFKDYNDHLIFEIYNEPRLVGTSVEWSFRASNEQNKECALVLNQLAQDCLDFIRDSGSVNAERYIMIPGYAASIDGSNNDIFQLPNDTANNKLIVSVHAYTPYNFALAPVDSEWSTDQFSLSNKSDTGAIDDLVKKCYNRFVSKGIPVVIGEFGTMEKGNTQGRVDCAAYFVAAAKEGGITCVWWDNNAFAGNGENFGLLRRLTCAWWKWDIVCAIMEYAK